jgi:hypothetical protein
MEKHPVGPVEVVQFGRHPIRLQPDFCGPVERRVSHHRLFW